MTRYFSLGMQVQAIEVARSDILEDGRDLSKKDDKVRHERSFQHKRPAYDLLACPERSWLPDCWGQRDQAPTMLFRVIFRPKGAVQELEILFSREETVLGCHPDAGDNMILNQPTEGFS